MKKKKHIGKTFENSSARPSKRVYLNAETVTLALELFDATKAFIDKSNDVVKHPEFSFMDKIAAHNGIASPRHDYFNPERDAVLQVFPDIEKIKGDVGKAKKVVLEGCAFYDLRAESLDTFREFIDRSKAFIENVDEMLPSKWEPITAHLEKIGFPYTGPRYEEEENAMRIALDFLNFNINSLTANRAAPAPTV